MRIRDTAVACIVAQRPLRLLADRALRAIHRGWRLLLLLVSAKEEEDQARDEGEANDAADNTAGDGACVTLLLSVIGRTTSGGSGVGSGVGRASSGGGSGSRAGCGCSRLHWCSRFNASKRLSQGKVKGILGLDIHVGPCRHSDVVGNVAREPEGL